MIFLFKSTLFFSMSVRFKSIHLQFISNTSSNYDMTRLVSVPYLSISIIKYLSTASTLWLSLFISFLVWAIRIHILILYLHSISTHMSSCLVLFRSNHLLLCHFEAIPSIIRYISNPALFPFALHALSPLHLISKFPCLLIISHIYFIEFAPNLNQSILFTYSLVHSNLFQSFSDLIISSHFLIPSFLFNSNPFLLYII